MKPALVFDFDGLIVDTETPDYMSWQESFAAFGCVLPLETWFGVVGSAEGIDLYAEMERQLGRPVDRGMIRAKRLPMHLARIAVQPVLPGVREAIADAKRLGMGLAVASSSPHSWVDTHLARLGLADEFSIVKCRDDVPRAKPAPDLFLAACEALNTPPSQAIALEDSLHGVTAAKRAGLFCVAVPNPLMRNLPYQHADLRLNSLAEMRLDDLLAQIQSRPDGAVKV